jgi:hypothetical protein
MTLSISWIIEQQLVAQLVNNKQERMSQISNSQTVTWNLAGGTND